MSFHLNKKKTIWYFCSMLIFTLIWLLSWNFYLTTCQVTCQHEKLKEKKQNKIKTQYSTVNISLNWLLLLQRWIHFLKRSTIFIHWMYYKVPHATCNNLGIQKQALQIILNLVLATSSNHYYFLSATYWNVFYLYICFWFFFCT